ncbi:hypothetical protein [Microtetraspora sp. NBRC 13810]|uniref:WXG100-like domain-containing protein n=1 Tax=Microtetraspora sp. NBRC 13810 TaxID=3030990 RepID=UPI00255259A2|nr:hypothetical protein [Microtetraspora sp. NBRC 13810]
MPEALRPYIDWVTGTAWPKGDPQGCFRMADACVTAAHQVVAGTVAADPGTAGLVGERWNGAAQEAFVQHVQQTLGGRRAELVRRLIDAAISLNGIGVTIQHAERLITITVLFLLTTLPLVILHAPWLLRNFLQVARLSAERIMINTLILMAVFAGVGGGLEYLTQRSQIAPGGGGRRDAYDWEQVRIGLRDGAINGLLTGLLAGGLGRLATPALRAGVARTEAAFGEKVLAFLTGTAPGQMLQYGVAGAATTALSLTIDGRPLDWDLILKGGTAAMFGADGQHLVTPHLTGPHTGGATPPHGPGRAPEAPGGDPGGPANVPGVPGGDSAASLARVAPAADVHGVAPDANVPPGRDPHAGDGRAPFTRSDPENPSGVRGHVDLGTTRDPRGDRVTPRDTAGTTPSGVQHVNPRLADADPAGGRQTLDPSTGRDPVPADASRQGNRIDAHINGTPDAVPGRHNDVRTFVPDPRTAYQMPPGLHETRLLSASVDSGITHRITLPSDHRAVPEAHPKVQLIGFKDGTDAVYKDLVNTEARDAEYFGAKLKRAAGADVPPVVPHGERGVYVRLIDGREPRLPWDGQHPWYAGRHERTASGVLAGLGYALTLDHDGKPSHIRIGDEGVVRTFDSDMAFRALLPDQNNPFVRSFFDGDRFVDNPLTRGDVDLVRSRISAFEREMRVAGRGDWFDNAMTMLDHIEKHAKGKVSIFDLPGDAIVPPVADRRTAVDSTVDPPPQGARPDAADIPAPRSVDLDPATREPLLPVHTPAELALLRGDLANTIHPDTALRPAQWEAQRSESPTRANGDPDRTGRVYVERRQMLVEGADGVRHKVTEFAVTVRYRADEGVWPQHLTKMMSDAMDGVDLHYNFQHRLADGSQFHVRLSFEEAPPHAPRSAYVLMSDGLGQADSGHWYLKFDPAAVVHVDPSIVAAHEIGHLLGLPDEYRVYNLADHQTMTASGVRSERSIMSGPLEQRWSSGDMVMDHLGNVVYDIVGFTDGNLDNISRFLPELPEFTPGSAPPTAPGGAAHRGRLDLVTGRLIAPGPLRSLMRDFDAGSLDVVQIIDRAEAIFGDRVRESMLNSDYMHYGRALTDTAEHFYGPQRNMLLGNDLARLHDLAEMLGAAPGGDLPAPGFVISRLQDELGVQAVEPRVVEGLARMAEWVTETGRRQPGDTGFMPLDRLAADLTNQPQGAKALLQAAHLFSDAAEQSSRMAEGRGMVDYAAADARLADVIKDHIANNDPLVFWDVVSAIEKEATARESAGSSSANHGQETSTPP